MTPGMLGHVGHVEHVEQPATSVWYNVEPPASSVWNRSASQNRSVSQITQPESDWNIVTKNKRGRSTKTNKDIDSVSLEEERQIGEVNNFKGEWEVIKVTVDSGAVDTVTPPSTAKYFPILETDASRRGLDYRAANGTNIKNHGARSVQGISSEFKPMNLIMNVADVRKTLASAFQIVAAGRIR